MADNRQPPTELLRIPPGEHATFGLDRPLLDRRGTRDWYGVYGYTVLAAIKSGRHQPVASFDILLHGMDVPRLSMATPNRPGYTPRDNYPSVVAVIGTSALAALTELSQAENDDDYFESLSRLPPLETQSAEPGESFQRSNVYEVQFDHGGEQILIANTDQRDLLILAAPNAAPDRIA